MLEIEYGKRSCMNNSEHNIEGCLFDLDGVLVDAADWHKDALNRALVMFSLEPISEEDHIKTYNGLSTYKKLEMLNVNPILHKALYDEKQRRTIDIIKEKCKPISRIIETVELANLIFDKDNVAVVTNCSRHTAQLMLELSGLSHLFEFLVTNEDVEGHVKPSPWPYMLAQQKFGIDGQKKILAIDDTDRGIMSARDAHCRTWFLKNFEDLTSENLIKILASYKFPL